MTCRCMRRKHLHLDCVVVLELDDVPKIGHLSFATLKMTKGKKTCSWPPCLVVDPFVRPTWCRGSPLSSLHFGECRWRVAQCLALLVIVRRWTFWSCSCSRCRCRGRPEMKCLAYPSQDSNKYEWEKEKNYTKCTLTDVENGSMITQCVTRK